MDKARAVNLSYLVEFRKNVWICFNVQKVCSGIAVETISAMSIFNKKTNIRKSLGLQ